MTDESTPDPQQEIDTATSAPQYEFHGIKLEPFSFDRNACFQRCAYEAWNGKIESQFESLCAIVFFCTLGDQIVQSDYVGEVKTPVTGWDLIDYARGENKIRALRRRIGEWMDEHAVNANSEDGRECYRIGLQIWNDMEKARFRPIPQKGSAPDPNV